VLAVVCELTALISSDVDIGSLDVAVSEAFMVQEFDSLQNILGVLGDVVFIPQHRIVLDVSLERHEGDVLLHDVEGVVLNVRTQVGNEVLVSDASEMLELMVDFLKECISGVGLHFAETVEWHLFDNKILVR